MDKQSLSFKQADHDDLYERFVPGNCYPQCSKQDISEILWLVEQRVFIMDRQPPYQASPKACQIDIPSKSILETELHHLLKQEATEWLMVKHGVEGVLYEQPAGAGISDVISKCGKWVVECGGSRPSKVVDFYGIEGNAGKSIVLFNEYGLTVFMAGESLKSYLKHMGLKAVEMHQRFTKF